jgi:hypothetical protein
LSNKDAIAAEADNKTKPDILFSSVTDPSKILFRHEEDKFVDFKTQPLLPRMLSHEGPGLAAGDVNDDGLQDLFIGAAAGYSSAIFLQKKDGTFARKDMIAVNTADNMGALFFDADIDGDADLYISSGGSAVVKKDDTTFSIICCLMMAMGILIKKFSCPL